MHRVDFYLCFTFIIPPDTYYWQDIRPSNILVNGFASNALTDLRPFLDSGHARFALCDFGLSIKFSPDTSPEERLLPSEECNFGTYEYQPPDGSDGEPFYDPFAFDVACLGGLFCELIGVCSTLLHEFSITNVCIIAFDNSGSSFGTIL